MRWNLPNLLTWLRIILLPVFIGSFYLFPNHKWLATALFALMGFSDWLDGYLARKLEQQSAFGAFLDPVADKLAVVSALLLLLTRYPTPSFAIICIVIIGREITISALREWMAGLGDRQHVAVSYIGKIKTTAQMLALGFLLYQDPLLGLPIADIGFWGLCVAAVLTLWSMLVYLKAAWPSMTRLD